MKSCKTQQNHQRVIIFQMAIFDEDGHHIASVGKVKDVPLGKFNDSRSKFLSPSKAN